jgi:phenylacetate-CoA ligase
VWLPLKCFLKRQKTSRETGNSNYQRYGASELDLIAFQSRNTETKGMEINSETLFVEILDDKGAVLPYGKKGALFLIQQSPSVYSL